MRRTQKPQEIFVRVESGSGEMDSRKGRQDVLTKPFLRKKLVMCVKTSWLCPYAISKAMLMKGLPTLDECSFQRTVYLVAHPVGR